MASGEEANNGRNNARPHSWTQRQWCQSQEGPSAGRSGLRGRRLTETGVGGDGKGGGGEDNALRFSLEELC